MPFPEMETAGENPFVPHDHYRRYGIYNRYQGHGYVPGIFVSMNNVCAEKAYLEYPDSHSEK